MASTHPTAASLASTGTTTFLVVAALLIVAVLMVVVAVWLIRATRRDPPALAPLERMGDRSWRKADPEARAASLAAARPPDAVAPAAMIEFEPEPAAEPAIVAESDDTDDERVDTVVTAAPDEADEPEPTEAADAEVEASVGDDGEAEDEDGPGYARTDG